MERHRRTLARLAPGGGMAAILELARLTQGPGQACEFDRDALSDDGEQCRKPAIVMVQLECTCGKKRYWICADHLAALKSMEEPCCDTCGSPVRWWVI